MPTAGPAAGHGYVVLDAPGEPAKAALCFGAASTAPSRSLCFAQRPLCAHLPCVAELPLGERRIVFGSTSDDTHESVADVVVGRTPVVLRHALGYRKEHRALASGGAAAILVGVPVAVLGGSVLVGNELGTLEGASSSGPARDIGVASVVVGTSLIAAGITLALLGRPEVQPGATTTGALPTRSSGVRWGGVPGLGFQW